MSKPIKLLRHPHTPARIPTPWVRVDREGETLFMTFRIPGDTSMIELPAPIEPLVKHSAMRRADRLWEHTCFECFVRLPGETGYLEFNFSPSMEWAAYSFDRYREGMRNARVSVPALISTAFPHRFELSASVQLPEWVDRPWLLNPAAIIEQKDGTKSYWATAHPPGSPDFHHPDCFTLELAPPGRP